MAHILIIDDDHDVLETMESIVSRMGHASVTAGSLSDARRIAQADRPDVVFLDIRLPDGNGLDLLPMLAELPEPPEVIILTGKGDSTGAEVAFNGGAWDYLVKPSSIKEITLSLERAIKYREEKQDKAAPVALDLDGVAGTSRPIREVFDKVAMASASDANVLVTGETGTGKELISRTIHANSARGGEEFVVVDCAALTENLVESILFGHRKGAFTSAFSDSVGLIKTADRGTLFLDEVGEMPLAIQRAFLRVLQERRFRPVGETREVTSDFRLISATNRDLAAMVEEGRFRKDLLFRLKTVEIHIPPLRDRLEDLRPLCIAHVSRLCARYKIPLKGFAADFFHVLEGYDWPGNVRELFNMLERTVVVAGSEPTLYSKHLPRELRISAAKAQLDRRRPGEEGGADPLLEGAETLAPVFEDTDLPSLKEVKSRVEKTYLEAMLRETGGDVARMTAISGLSRSHLYALLKKYGLST